MEAYIEIGYPVLESGESFGIRYRELPAGAWIDFGIITSNSFTLTGLDVGGYEVEITFITNEGVECTPTIITIDIQDEPACVCGYLTDVYVQRNCNQTATLYATFDDNFECAIKWLLTYTTFGGLSPTTLTYTEKPDTVTIPISDNGSSVPPNITLQIECCDGSVITCNDFSVSDIRDCACKTATSVLSADIGYNETTEQYTLNFNFNAGDPAPTPPYTVKYYQLNTISPVTPIEVDETDDGFYSYDVTVVPHTGSLTFRIEVTTHCGVATKDVEVLRCGSSFNFNGGESFPYTVGIYIGGGTGQVNINYNAQSVPDKFILRESGIERDNSGYRGSAAYQPMLDANLISRGLPIEPIVGTGIGTIYYYSATPMDWVFVDVYAPLPNTQWSFSVTCQITY